MLLTLVVVGGVYLHMQHNMQHATQYAGNAKKNSVILLALPSRRLAGQQNNCGRKEKYLSFCNSSSVLRVVLHVHPHARVTKTRLFLAGWPCCCCCLCCWCCCCHCAMPSRWLVQYRVLQKKQPHRHQQVRLEPLLHPPTPC